MAFEPTAAEVRRLNNLPSEERYKFFIETVAKHKQMFAYTDGNRMGMMEGQDLPGLLLVWPAMTFVDAFCLDENRELPELTIAVQISLAAVFDHYLPALKREGFGVGVFPDPDGHLAELSVEQFEADLRGALDASPAQH
ncbi:DUF2750 domain-containing protein [Phyllobacterium sp. 22229]|uniref:DUF2750 domain-containing protein n=1 Tax=Phyllobacterium sp. 22229 TaxID=3453895 RepID=UPI003F84DBA0